MSGKDANLQRVRADFSQLEGVLLIFITASNARLTISCHRARLSVDNTFTSRATVLIGSSHGNSISMGTL